MEQSKLVSRKFWYIFFLSVAAIVLIYLFVNLSQPTFRVTSINPNPSSVNILTPEISLNYSQQLSQSGFNLQSSSGLVYNYSIVGKTLLLQLQTPLNKNTSYFIKILIYSSSKLKNSTTINFKAAYANESNLGSDQKNYILNNQSGQTPPINGISNLPYDGPDYQLTISNSTSPPSVLFTYVPSVWDNSQGTSAEAVAINNAKTWLAQHNISTSIYQLFDSSTGQLL